MDGFLKQSTAATIKLGPFLDATDAVTAEGGLTISQADIRLSKNGGDMAQTNNAAGATHDELGYYDVPLDTTDTNTVGRLRIAVSESGALPVWADFMVLPANVYDSLVGGSDKLDVNAAEWAGSATDSGDVALVAAPSNFAAFALTAGGAVTVGSIANDAITAASIATGAIDADAIADNAIDAAAIAADAITAAKIATGAIDADAIADNAIDAGAIASDAITAAKIATGAITSAKFAAGAITATVIATDAIDADALAASAVTEIAAGVVSGGMSNPITYTYTVYEADAVTPLSDVTVWVSTDSAGSNVVASGTTDNFGEVEFQLDAGVYYVFRQKAGWNFTNPDTETVS